MLWVSSQKLAFLKDPEIIKTLDAKLSIFNIVVVAKVGTPEAILLKHSLGVNLLRSFVVVISLNNHVYIPILIYKNTFPILGSILGGNIFFAAGVAIPYVLAWVWPFVEIWVGIWGVTWVETSGVHLKGHHGGWGIGGAGFGGGNRAYNAFGRKLKTFSAK